MRLKIFRISRPPAFVIFYICARVLLPFSNMQYYTTALNLNSLNSTQKLIFCILYSSF